MRRGDEHLPHRPRRRSDRSAERTIGEIRGQRSADDVRHRRIDPRQEERHDRAYRPLCRDVKLTRVHAHDVGVESLRDPVHVLRRSLRPRLGHPLTPPCGDGLVRVPPDDAIQVLQLGGIALGDRLPDSGGCCPEFGGGFFRPGQVRPLRGVDDEFKELIQAPGRAVIVPARREDERCRLHGEGRQVPLAGEGTLDRLRRRAVGGVLRRGNPAVLRQLGKELRADLRTREAGRVDEKRDHLIEGPRCRDPAVRNTLGGKNLRLA